MLSSRHWRLTSQARQKLTTLFRLAARPAARSNISPRDPAKVNNPAPTSVAVPPTAQTPQVSNRTVRRCQPTAPVLETGQLASPSRWCSPRKNQCRPLPMAALASATVPSPRVDRPLRPRWYRISHRCKTSSTGSNCPNSLLKATQASKIWLNNSEASKKNSNSVSESKN